MENQMIFRRYELKYRLTRPQMEALKGEMKKHMRPDPHGRSTVQSLYFDTPDFLLVRRSMEHPLYKEKLRLRSYGVAEADTPVFLELKKKFDSVVYKRRIELPLAQAEDYVRTGVKPRDTQIMREIDYCMAHYPDLKPRMLLSYQREAFYGAEDGEFRMTFDDTILWREEDLSLSAGIGGRALLPPDTVLLEVKCAGAMPLWLAHWFSANHIYKTSFSKYGTAYQTKFREARRQPAAKDTLILPFPAREEYCYA